jgi:glucose/arabinose dehydrogenase
MKKLDSEFRKIVRFARFSVVLLFSCVVLKAQPNIQLQDKLADGLLSPIHIANAGDGSGRLFVAEKAGVIKVFTSTFKNPAVYLDLTSLVNSGGEAGLLSIAFHPLFETNGALFVHYVNKSGNLVVARYESTNPSANVMDDATPTVVLPITHGGGNHYGGEMHFGSDGFLYISVGDGGGGNDVGNNAQNTTGLLGKMLRIDVATSGTATYTNPSDNPFPTNTILPRNEVFSIGLRNPFRWSFDSETGDFWIGDVGQGLMEEIDFCPLAQAKGVNYGWRCYEGNARTPAYTSGTYTAECSAYSNFSPQYVYPRSQGVSVVGGVVYRGEKYPMMNGYYIGSDYYTGRFHIIAPGSAAGTISATTPATKGAIADYGEGEDGEIYAVALDENKIYQIIDGNALPVRLVDFTARPGAEGVSLSWKTASEENFRQFDVEFSTTGSQFQYLGTVNSQSTEKGSSYSFTHAINSGMAYYRLKMIDKDESFAYSRIISVNLGEIADGGIVKPSLITTGNMVLDLSQKYQSMELINTSGKVFLKKDISGKSGKIDVNVNMVSSGLYVVRLLGDDIVTQQKVVIIP